eukprot:439498_1
MLIVFSYGGKKYYKTSINPQYKSNTDIKICFMEGWIQKKSLYMGVWNSRWIEIIGHYMYSFRTKYRTKGPTEIFDLKKYNKVYHNKKAPEFKISSSKTARSFIAPSTEVMMKWITAIKQAQQYDRNIIQVPIQINFNIPGSKTSQKKIFVCAYIDFKQEATIHDLIQQIFIAYKEYRKIDLISIFHKYTQKQTTNSIVTLRKVPLIQEGMEVYGGGHGIVHQVEDMEITCKFMKGNNDPNSCSIYHDMINKEIFTKENYIHLKYYNHFADEYKDKVECKFNEECKSFKNLDTGGNDIDDLCHMLLYRHPPRSGRIKMTEGFGALIFNTKIRQNCFIHLPTKAEKEIGKKSNFIFLFINEVIKNGSKADLYLGNEGAVNNLPQNNLSKYPIMVYVISKLNSIRHQLMGRPLNLAEMLALVLYTSGQCNYDLCKSQRNGDYVKWKWFDYLLFNAI